MLEGVEIIDVAAEGNALARVNDMVVFVPFGAPGDVADVKLDRKKSSYAEGHIERMIKPSAIRETPRCEHFGICGGCRWQHLPYEFQLQCKQKQVKDALERIAKIPFPEITPILGSESIWEYRNKMEYTFSSKMWLTFDQLRSGEEFPDRRAAGFHIPGAFDKVLDINACHLQDDLGNRIRRFIKGFGKEKGLEFYDLRENRGFLRTLMIRIASTGEVMVVMQVGEDGEVLSIIELDPWQQQQLQQFMHNMELMDQAKNPEADAMLEATDPTVEHNPADLLETAVDEQAGSAIGQAVESAKPQEKDEDQQAQVIDVDQGPQQLFHDVKAAPVKVGDVYNAEQVDEPNVVQQIDAGLAQALQKGESMVRIQLNPENLGSVTIEISQSAEGIIRVALSAHSSETRGLLERHAANLQNMLGNRGQSVQVEVQHQEESQQGQDHPYEGHNGSNAQSQEERRQRQERQQETISQDFAQQLRLGLIPEE